MLCLTNIDIDLNSNIQQVANNGHRSRKSRLNDAERVIGSMQSGVTGFLQLLFRGYHCFFRIYPAYKDKKDTLFHIQRIFYGEETL